MRGGVRTVLIIGATSYLGGFLLSELLERGIRVVAVTHGSITSQIFLNRFHDRIILCRSEDVREGEADVVINLAYLKQSIPVGMFKSNRKIVKMVQQLAVRAGADRLIHVSSAAVFGYAPRSLPKPIAAPRIMGDSYLELKADAERRIIANAKEGYIPVIVRPGNIIGPNAPTWVSGVIQRIIEGRPVAIVGRDGFANATYVKNLAYYLADLVEIPLERLRAFGTYHHVAEFSAHRWSELISAYSSIAGLEPVFTIQMPRTSAGKIISDLANWAVRAYRGWLGHLMRRALGTISFEGLGQRMFFDLKARLVGASFTENDFVSSIDANYYSIVSADLEFRSHIINDWTPPIRWTEAIAEIKEALHDGGFDLDAPLAIPYKSEIF